MSDTSVELHPQPAPAAAPADSASAPQADVIPPAPPATEATTRRRAAAPVMPAFGLPHVASSDIRAELRRREARIEKLLAERAALVAEMEQIEATLESLRED